MSRSSKRTRSQIFKSLKAVMNSYWKVKSTWEQLLIIPSETHHNSFKTTKVNEVKARDTWGHWKLFSHKSNLKKKYPWCHGQNIHALNPEKYWRCLETHSFKYIPPNTKIIPSQISICTLHIQLLLHPRRGPFFSQYFYHFHLCGYCCWWISPKTSVDGLTPLLSECLTGTSMGPPFYACENTGQKCLNLLTLKLYDLYHLFAQNICISFHRKLQFKT